MLVTVGDNKETNRKDKEMTQAKPDLFFHSYHRNTIKHIDEAVWLDRKGDVQEEQYAEDKEYLYTLVRDKP